MQKPQDKQELQNLCKNLKLQIEDFSNTHPWLNVFLQNRQLRIPNPNEFDEAIDCLADCYSILNDIITRSK
jgi:uncharacterized protein YbaP (TraB family)